MGRMRKAMLLSFVLAAGAVEAAALAVVPSTRMHHENWYPLTESEMTSAAVDTALAGLTRSQTLQLRERKGEDVGTLRFDVHLIERAESARLTITLNHPRAASVVASASTTLARLDHRGIYQAFEHIGREAATMMQTKLKAFERLPTRPTDMRVDSWAGKQYALAQELKERGEFYEAKVALETIVISQGEGVERWKDLAQEELRYHLPLFEAGHWESGLGLVSIDTAKASAETLRRAEQKYRQIMAENQSKPEHYAVARARLDQLLNSLRHLGQAARAGVLAGVAGLRIMLLEHYDMYGAWPDRAMLERDILANVDEAYALDEIARSDGALRLVMRHQPSGERVVLVGTAGRVPKVRVE